MSPRWRPAGGLPTNVAVSGNRESDGLVEDASAAAIAAALEQVGARLKRIRTQRGMTLSGVAEATGISKSTLSRLETGQRRPTLELLLALSHTYRVPLDDLVGAPPEGDPRLRLKPGRVKGPDRDPVDPSGWRDAGLEDRHPDRQRHPGAPCARRARMDLRSVRAYAVGPRTPGQRARAWRGRRLRHHGAALVRQHRRRTRGNPQHLRTTRRTDDHPNNTRPERPFEQGALT